MRSRNQATTKPGPGACSGPRGRSAPRISSRCRGLGDHGSETQSPRGAARSDVTWNRSDLPRGPGVLWGRGGSRSETGDLLQFGNRGNESPREVGEVALERPEWTTHRQLEREVQRAPYACAELGGDDPLRVPDRPPRLGVADEHRERERHEREDRPRQRPHPDHPGRRPRRDPGRHRRAPADTHDLSGRPEPLAARLHFGPAMAARAASAGAGRWAARAGTGIPWPAGASISPRAVLSRLSTSMCRQTLRSGLERRAWTAAVPMGSVCRAPRTGSGGPYTCHEPPVRRRRAA